MLKIWQFFPFLTRIFPFLMASSLSGRDGVQNATNLVRSRLLLIGVATIVVTAADFVAVAELALKMEKK